MMIAVGALVQQPSSSAGRPRQVQRQLSNAAGTAKTKIAIAPGLFERSTVRGRGYATHGRDAPCHLKIAFAPVLFERGTVRGRGYATHGRDAPCYGGHVVLVGDRK